ncbi:MAG: DUF1573 domain-containing protein [Phycisphaerae bacterium]|nr:DUF1573 domain-containing protein [Phycisphaerae bacterium]
MLSHVAARKPRLATCLAALGALGCAASAPVNPQNPSPTPPTTAPAPSGQATDEPATAPAASPAAPTPKQKGQGEDPRLERERTRARPPRPNAREAADAPTAREPADPVQEGAIDAPPPITVTPQRLDFGFMLPNTNARGTVTLTNGGTAPVTLLSVTASCKCTTINDAAGVTIEPGKSFVIETELSGAPMQGMRRSQLKIIAKGYARPVNVAVQGEVALPVRAVPAYINLVGERARAGETIIESTDGTPFRVLSVNGKPATIVPQEAPGDVHPRHKLAWSFPEGEAIGDFWIVETDHPNCGLVDVRIRNANPIKRPVLRMREYRINAGRIDPVEGVRIEVQSKDATTPFDVVSVKGGVACPVTAELIESRKEDEGMVAVIQLKPLPDVRGFFADTLIVGSGGKLQELDLFGTIRPKPEGAAAPAPAAPAAPVTAP